VKDVSGDLLSAYMPTETAAGCGKKADLVAATLADPKSFAANRALGLFYLGHGEAARSIPYLQQSYAVAPDPVKSARELALAMIMAGQYSGAIPILKSAAANDRNNLVIRRLLALSYGAMGDLRRSAAEYKRASTLDSGADNLFECGIGLIGVGDGNDARQLFSAATHGNPGSAKLWTGLGIAQEFQQQKKEALRSLLRAVALDPDYIPPYAFLAGLVGVSADADSELQQRLAALVLARPDSAEAHYDYGLALWKKHMLSPAEVSIPEIQSQLRLAIELDPAMVRAHFQRGVLFADSGDYRDAVAEFQVVVKLQPNNATGHYRLAFAYRRQGRTEQANLEMRRFLDIHRSQETAGDTPGSDIQKAVLRQSHWKASAGPCPSDVRTLK
jgi:tetratricopeptide (TPR) repeat protein